MREELGSSLREEVAAGRYALAFGLHALDVLGRDEVEGLRWSSRERGSAFPSLFEILGGDGGCVPRGSGQYTA